MMNLKNVLDEMDIKADYVGTMEFDTMALIGVDGPQKYCTFIDNDNFLNNINENISIIITNKKLAENLSFLNICIVEQPRIIYFMVHNYLVNNYEYARTKYIRKIGSGCRISNLASIANNNVIIGKNVVIEDFVSIKENTVIRDDCIIRAGSIIGGSGFEFKRHEDSIISVEHLGGVIINSNVEIQYNTCIDRAVYPWDNTIIGVGSKIDNHVHVAHGVKIGSKCLVVAHSSIGGRTIIGDNCWIGLSACIRNGLTIGNNARVNMGSVVTKDVGNNESVSGNFAIGHNKFIKHLKEL